MADIIRKLNIGGHRVLFLEAMRMENKRRTALKAISVRVAFIVTMVALFVGFWLGRASACESYEECMKSCGPSGFYDKDLVIHYYSESCTKAAAYKLNEISILLKQQSQAQNPIMDAFLKNKKESK